MTPRKKIHAGPAERMQAARKRRIEAGQRQITVWLTESAIAKLDRLAESDDAGRSGVIEALIEKAE